MDLPKPVKGVINILKPPGMTSHDVVNIVRRIYKTRKVGHTGTLDPAATGVLPICVGRATKIAQYITGADKTYRAEIKLGITTDTQDGEGQALKITDASAIKEERFLAVLDEFVGELKQIPPMASAVKIKGKKLYELHRKGQEVERPPRNIKIHYIKNIWSAEWGTPNPRILIEVHCSKGTYIRTLCHDIGEKISVGAHMSFLLRTKVAQFNVNDSITLEELEEMPDPTKALISINDALIDYPEVTLREQAVKSVTSGAKLYPPGVLSGMNGISAGQIVRLIQGNELLALAESQKEKLDDKTRLVFKPVCMIKIDQ